jgi:flagellar biosynthesis component FlhA
MPTLRQCRSYAIFCAYPIALLPISAVCLDTFCAVSLLVSLVFAYGVTRHPEAAKSWVAPAVEISAVYRLTLYAPIARLVLDDTAALDDWIIKPLAQVIAQGNLPGLVLFTNSLLLAQLFFLSRLINSVSETASRFALDVLPNRTREIKAAVHAKELKQAAADALMTKLYSDADFFGRLDGLMRHVRREMRIGLVITLVMVTIGVLSRSLIHDEPLFTVILHFGSLGSAANLISCAPLAVISGALRYMAPTDDQHPDTHLMDHAIARHSNTRGKWWQFLAR